MTLDSSTVGHWSRTQAVVALSSGEAEYYALSHAAVECTYLQNLLSELGYTAVSEVRNRKGCFDVYTDSNAAKSMALGGSAPSRAKHIDIRHHFLHDLIMRKEMDVERVTSEDNVADLLTKGLPADLHRKHVAGLGLH